jgi:hypothetical protein
MAIVNITCENDADFYRAFVYQTVDSTGTIFTPVDLTGNKLRMGLRRNATDVAEELLLTTENGALAFMDPTQGQFTVRITQSQLEQLQIGDYQHSLIRTTLAAEQYRIWSGSLTNNPGPSR